MAPDSRSSTIKFGQWSLETGAFLEAKHNFRKCLDTDRRQFVSSMDQGIFGFKSMLHLGMAEMGLGHYEVAKGLWLKTMEVAPYWAIAVPEMFDAAMKAKDYPVANAMMERIKANDGFGQFWAACMSDYQDAVVGPGGGIGFLSSLIEQQPGYHGVRLTPSHPPDRRQTPQRSRATPSHPRPAKHRPRCVPSRQAVHSRQRPQRRPPMANPSPPPRPNPRRNHRNNREAKKYDGGQPNVGSTNLDHGNKPSCVTASRLFPQNSR